LTTDDPLADLDLGCAGAGKVEVGPGTEADHANALSGGDGIPGLFPAHDPPGDQSGYLAHEKGSLGGAQEPGLIFVAYIDLEVAGIEKLPRRVVGFFNRSGVGASVHVNIEDGEKNANAAKFPEAERGILRLVDADYFSVRRAEEGEGVGGRGAFGIPEKEEQADQEKGAQHSSGHPTHPKGDSQKSGGA